MSWIPKANVLDVSVTIAAWLADQYCCSALVAQNFIDVVRQ